MTARDSILGLDIGSVAVCAALLNQDRQVMAIGYAFHHGDLARGLAEALAEIELARVAAVAATTSTPRAVLAGSRYDNTVALIRAARHFHTGFGSILLIGGEKFGLLRFDAGGKYIGHRTNTSCAAGTGSFLDQQAARLQLADSAAVSRLAMAHTGSSPRIASRCAVFAKTDLIHAQQEGFSQEAICHGLCECLAKNVVDTLFGAERPAAPVLLLGGVARNLAVVDELRAVLGAEILVNARSHLYGAIGAALSRLAETGAVLFATAGEMTIAGLLAEERTHRCSTLQPPLRLERSTYPDLDAHESSRHLPGNGHAAVEVDVYARPAAGRIAAHLGIDIGSTSTKAVLIDSQRQVLVGTYTRTSGKPVQAVQAVLETFAAWARQGELGLEILGVGTTGSGRKLIGRIIGADLVLDEITAHARAATEIAPAVDTIIEIGGQDSKFTTLHNGRVTSAIMNNVCAAGTGSFIEEQANRLDCPLSELSARTEGVAAPPASDRCTVFMERDLNHLLSEGYSNQEVLAAVLHSVRENYLLKVAVEAQIGDTILFQGATAKIRSLVAAFEQRLGKPLIVSRYCHLTGALGTALALADEGVWASRFRGLDLYRRTIPLRSEVCELCNNSCKITVADLPGGSEAYGFLCGRDYNTGHFVDGNRSGFDLTQQRRAAFSFERTTAEVERPTVGIPAALHLIEDLPFWRLFFNHLGFGTVTSGKFRNAVARGKKLCGGEFCAPVAALFGHVDHLLQRDGVDAVFLPFYFEEQTADWGGRRTFCYYTQFAPSLVTVLGDRQRVLTPAVRGRFPDIHPVLQLYRALAPIAGRSFNIFQVAAAHDRAKKHRAAALAQLQRRMGEELAAADDISVMLLGRPYLVLDPALSRGIPTLFASQGVKCFFQEMLSYSTQDVAAIAPLLDQLHWRFASKILEAAEVIAATDGLYPVLLTAFHCSPDSFAVSYFRSLMQARGKPYLVLELDELDSRVGYETRIEAAVRAFRNHHALHRSRSTPARQAFFSPKLESTIGNRTVILPNWDALSCRLLAANLRREGIDAQLMRETEGSIQRSLSHNTGQCIPINAIAQGFIEHVTERELDPAKTLLWMIRSDLSCNLRMYGHHIKTLLDAHGRGFDGARIYFGKISFSDISPRASLNAYFAFLLGGYLRRLACRVRPYELQSGATDLTVQQSLAIFEDVMLGARPREAAVAEVVSLFEAIPRGSGRRPLVAVFGDLYSRDNEVMNQGLERFIERHGGEALPTPYTDHCKMVAGAYFKTWLSEGQLGKLLWSKALLVAATALEGASRQLFARLLGEMPARFDDPPEEILAEYNIRFEHAGESVENLLWAHHMSRCHLGLALFVQASPAFCCPALITEAMRSRIELHTGVPVVSVTYDGTGGNKNQAIVPYLEVPRVAS